MGVFLQYFAALSSALGAFCVGTALGFTSNLEKKILNFDYGFEVTQVQFSLLGSMLNFGAACVCILMGFMINWIGRRGTLLFVVIPFFLGWMLLVSAVNVTMLIIGRALIGVACGGCCVSGSIYVGEIADKRIRGKLSSFFQLLITSGIMFVYILGANVSAQMTCAICSLLPILFGICMFFCPESPTFYIMRGQPEEGIKLLKKLRANNSDVKSDINDLIDEEERRQVQNIGRALKRKSARKGMLIAFGLMFFQQLSGINAVIFYTTTIFSDKKLMKPENSTIIVGVIQVIATFVATMTVDKIGRRVLLVISGSLMAVCTLVLEIYYGIEERDSLSGLSWVPLFSLCVFIIAFSLGFGPIPWIYIGEIFSSDVKGIAGSMSSTLNWTLAFIVTVTFPTIRDLIGPSSCFIIFTVLSFIGAIFSYFVPETKGKSLAEIQKILSY